MAVFKDSKVKCQSLYDLQDRVKSYMLLIVLRDIIQVVLKLQARFLLSWRDGVI